MGMPDRAQALAEAADLEMVCRSRPLATTEAFEANAFYGNDRVLKRYAGIPEDRPLKVVVPHGIVFNDRYLWEGERRALLPAVLAYSGYRARAYERETAMVAMRCAVPFAYLPRLLGEAPPAARAGTLFFPSHSSHRVTTAADFAGLAEVLVRLDERFQPVTVCIYWRDFQLGRHSPFLDRGLRVVSAGHMYDPAFLFRLYYLCQSHRYACGNHVGSSLLYAVLAGCRFFVLQGFDLKHLGDEESLAADISRGGSYQQALAEAFAAPTESLTAGQSKLVEEVCGLDALHAPDVLRDLFDMAERLDRVGVARDPRTHRLHAAFPRHWLRTARDRVRAARRFASRRMRRAAARS